MAEGIRNSQACRALFVVLAMAGLADAYASDAGARPPSATATMSDALVDELCAHLARSSAEGKRRLGGRTLESLSDAELYTWYRGLAQAFPLPRHLEEARSAAQSYYNLRDNAQLQAKQRSLRSELFPHDPDDDAWGYLFEDELLDAQQRLGPQAIGVLERREAALRQGDCSGAPPRTAASWLEFASSASYRLLLVAERYEAEQRKLHAPPSGGPPGPATPPPPVPPAAGSARIGPLCTVDRWCWEEPRPQGNSLHGLGGTGPGDVWAVGEHGTVLHFDGAAWTRHPADTGASLHAVWARAADDVWFVGAAGTVRRWNGTRIESVAIDTTAKLLAVWGTEGGKVWVVGARGTILHFDGRGWTRQDHPRWGRLRGVRGFSDQDVWAVGEAGHVLHFDGSAWSRVSSSSPAERARLASLGLGSNGQQGGGVEPISPVAGEARWSSGPRDVWVAGERGLLLHFDGSGWSAASTTAELFPFGALWAKGRERWVFTDFGDGGPPRSWRWSGADKRPVSGTPHLRVVFGPSADNLWGVDGGGTAHRWDGETWSTAKTGLYQDVHGLWAAGPDDVWVCGGWAGLAHFDGQRWSKVALDAFQRPDLFALWGSSRRNIWAVGKEGDGQGVVLHFDGRAWRKEKTPPLPNVTLRAVAGRGPGSPWAVGTMFEQGAVVLRRERGRWGLTRLPQIKELRAVWVGGPADVWAVGDGGSIVHWNGRRWLTQDSGTDAPLTAVWGEAGHVWVAGPTAVLHRAP
jgi:hypothetical protein